MYHKILKQSINQHEHAKISTLLYNDWLCKSQKIQNLSWLSLCSLWILEQIYLGCPDGSAINDDIGTHWPLLNFQTGTNIQNRILYTIPGWKCVIIISCHNEVRHGWEGSGWLVTITLRMIINPGSSLHGMLAMKRPTLGRTWECVAINNVPFHSSLNTSQEWSKFYWLSPDLVFSSIPSSFLWPPFILQE